MTSVHALCVRYNMYVYVFNLSAAIPMYTPLQRTCDRKHDRPEWAFLPPTYFVLRRNFSVERNFEKVNIYFNFFNFKSLLPFVLIRIRGICIPRDTTERKILLVDETTHVINFQC